MQYIYVVTCHEQEMPLCQMELRALFGINPIWRGSSYIFVHDRKIAPSRSPFIKLRMDMVSHAKHWKELDPTNWSHQLGSRTFKVQAFESFSEGQLQKIAYQEKREIERYIGVQIKGQCSMKTPDVTLGVVCVEDQWYLGEIQFGEAIWLAHNDKPQQYSTALSTRVARAVVNIAVPEIDGVTVIDPCCGIGTVLMEAASMGIHIEGREINPLAAQGARANLEAFQYSCQVTLGDMNDIVEHYDTAILDMPYNLCSVVSEEEKQQMLMSARRIANRLLVVTVEPIDDLLLEAGFEIIDRCIIAKGKFKREIILCT